MWFRDIFRRIDQLKQASFLNTAPSAEQASLRLPPQALHQLNRLQLTAGRYLPGKAAGLRSSLRRKPAHDFREHRLYIPGDDVRFVDWTASARQEHIFIRQGEQPKEATVYILLDCSASMSWGAEPKHLRALELAAALGYSALAHGDRLLVQPFGQQAIQPLGPVSGKGQFPAVLNYLRAVRFMGSSDLAAALRQFSYQRKGGLTLILSDLLDVGDLHQALDHVPSPAWDVILLHMLHPDELNPDIQGDFQMVDVETGRKANYDVDTRALKVYLQKIEAWRNELEMICVEHNAFYSLIPTGWSLTTEILPHLRSILVLRPQ
jgi:uncharacterized protein (DUF58 family)